MIPNGEGWYYLALKKLPALLTELTSKSRHYFYCLNCLHFLATENKSKSHRKVCENKDFCNIVMLSEDIKILHFNQFQKFDKASFTTYGGLEFLIEKIDGSKNNSENLYTTKISENIPPSF